MCSWAQTSPVCQSISFQNETCGTPGKVGWCLMCSGFILLFYTYASWFHMVLFCQWMGDFAIWMSEKWDFVNIYLTGILSFPFFTCDQRFSSYESVQVWAEINCISGILFCWLYSSHFQQLLQRNNFFIFHWLLPVLILKILEETSRVGYVLSAKDILILRESLALGKHRNMFIPTECI